MNKIAIKKSKKRFIVGVVVAAAFVAVGAICYKAYRASRIGERGIATVDIIDSLGQIAPAKPINVERTGISGTATYLGNILSTSAQNINKRLVENGLATKLPCGEYALTDRGKQFGTETIKTTKHGHTFSNIEWDTSVVSLIASENELRNLKSPKGEMATD